MEQSEDYSSFLSFPSLILKKILSNLSTADLLTCSLVCKACNYESRCLLRDRRSLVAAVKGQDPCLKLLELEALLSSMPVIPFSGLRLCVTAGPNCTHCLQLLDIDLMYSSILKMNIKYLQVNWTCSREPHEEEPDDKRICAAALLLRKILQRGQPEYCHMIKLPWTLDLCSPKVMLQLELPNLRILRLEDENKHHPGSGFHLMRAAPNLEQLHANVWPVEGPIFLETEDKLKCVTVLSFHPLFQNELVFLERLALAGPKLQKLKLHINAEMNFWGRPWRIVKLLLENCCQESLKYLQIDIKTALKLMNLQVAPLKRLEKLEIWGLCDLNGDLNLIPLLGNIDFAVLFPSLKSLRLDTKGSNFREGELESYFAPEELDQRQQLSHGYEGGLIS